MFPLIAGAALWWLYSRAQGGDVAAGGDVSPEVQPFVLKDSSVDISALDDGLESNLPAMAEVFNRLAGVRMVITSGDESQAVHKMASAHYEGRAVDLHTTGIPDDVVRQIVTELRSRLGGSYLVLNEVTPPAGGSTAWSGPHIHVQVD